MYDLIIVEDEDEVRNGLMEFFPWEKFGFHAVAAFDNGRAALEYCRKNKVDVVLTDIRKGSDTLFGPGLYREACLI